MNDDLDVDLINGDLIWNPFAKYLILFHFP